MAGAPAVGVVLARALGFGREPVAARTAGTTGLAGDRDGAVVQGAYRSVVPVGDIRQWRSHRRDDATR
ncbi:hypothetical protein [Spirilliplanes yamanashiensis]|uniref:hypothetical protein n=1 Tax=Spirilliplanes yamanashiensis TaxID=42233 RepID=UPI00195162D2|nr:hypothetical protein [Spirilliplanes yamanashiensis]MDP9818325.1 hypothetical protein [Spirilliplanes yamanashiensis]